MSTGSSLGQRSHLRFGTIAAIGLALGLAACTSGAGAGGPSRAASPGEPTAAPTSTGPTAFADWTARQGFGGSFGLRNVLKLADWLSHNPGSADTYELNSDLADVNALVGWLDAHPATACWATYHDRVRASLAKLDAPYAKAIEARTAGNVVTPNTTTEIVNDAQAAMDEPAPASCP